jgi:predicted alpha/beta superfamily hydrolase
MTRAVALLMLITLTLSCGSELVDSERRTDPPGALADTESRVISSSITGRTYQISVALPRGYQEADTSYPVLVALDANMQFGTVVEAVRSLGWFTEIPELLVVGIGYPVGRGWNAAGPRAVDLTPTEDQDRLDKFAKEYPAWPVLEGSGGAPGFLRFIREELIPIIERDYKASSQGRALYGHSLGGLFAAYALFKGESTFHRFIIGSPSLWWDNRLIFEYEEAYASSHDSLPARVFLSAGLSEEEVGDEIQNPFAGVSNLRDLSEVLDRRAYIDLTWQTHVFEGETHLSVIPATISRGLRFVYAQ